MVGIAIRFAAFLLGGTAAYLALRTLRIRHVTLTVVPVTLLSFYVPLRLGGAGLNTLFDFPVGVAVVHLILNWRNRGRTIRITLAMLAVTVVLYGTGYVEATLAAQHVKDAHSQMAKALAFTIYEPSLLPQQLDVGTHPISAQSPGANRIVAILYHEPLPGTGPPPPPIYLTLFEVKSPGNDIVGQCWVPSMSARYACRQGMTPRGRRLGLVPGSDNHPAVVIVERGGTLIEMIEENRVPAYDLTQDAQVMALVDSLSPMPLDSLRFY
jgi:hypothetical protein